MTATTQAKQPNCTKFTLRYTDAHNFKKEMPLFLSGLLSEEQLNTLSQNLIDGTQLTAGVMGLPCPIDLMLEEDNNAFSLERDHVFTEVAEIESDFDLRAESLWTFNEIEDVRMSTDEFVAAVVSANTDQWMKFIGAEEKRLIDAFGVDDGEDAPDYEEDGETV